LIAGNFEGISCSSHPLHPVISIVFYDIIGGGVLVG